MIIGSCMVELMIYDSDSLKDKRKVVKSLIGRLQSKFNASVAEVDLNDKWRYAVIGFACVSNDTVHANKMVSSILNYIEKDTRVEIINTQVEIL